MVLVKDVHYTQEVNQMEKLVPPLIVDHVSISLKMVLVKIAHCSQGSKVKAKFVELTIVNLHK